MYEPNYADYSLDQLQDCLVHIHKDKYPERYRRLQQEIALRSERGESLADPGINELTAVDVPLIVGVLALWGFLWRMAIAIVFCMLATYGMIWINAILRIFSPTMLLIVETLVVVPFMTAAAIVTMMQMLARPYPGYRIRIVRLHGSPEQSQP